MKITKTLSAVAIGVCAFSLSAQAATIAFNCERGVLQNEITLTLDTDRLTYTAVALDRRNNDAPIYYKGFMGERKSRADRVSYSFNHDDLTFDLHFSPSDPSSAEMGVEVCKQVRVNGRALKAMPR